MSDTARLEATNLDAIQIALEKRARLLAVPLESSTHANAPSFRALVVCAGQQRLGIPLLAIELVVCAPPITRVPGTPEWFTGLAQIKGELLGVVDLGRWLELDRGPRPGTLVVVAGAPGKLALLVDEIVALREIHDAELSPPLRDERDAAARPFVATTLDLVSIVALDRLLESERIRIGSGSRSSRGEVR